MTGAVHKCATEAKAELVIPAMVYRIFRKYMPVLFLLQGVSIEVCSPEWGRGVKGSDREIRRGKWGVIGRPTVRIHDANALGARTRVYENLREFTRVFAQEC